MFSTVPAVHNHSIKGIIVINVIINSSEACLPSKYFTNWVVMQLLIFYPIL